MWCIGKLTKQCSIFLWGWDAEPQLTVYNTSTREVQRVITVTDSNDAPYCMDAEALEIDDDFDPEIWGTRTS